MLQISVTDTGVHDEIARLIRRFDNPQPALRAIGEILVEFTKERFARSSDPYGTPWAPNAETTLRAALARHSKHRTKSGQPSALGQRFLAGKKPLIGESKSLSTQIHYRLLPGTVEVRSSMVYAAIHQFGGTIHMPARSQLAYFRQDKDGTVGNRFVHKSRSNFAQWVTRGEHTITIPARPFFPDPAVGLPADLSARLRQVLSAALAGPAA